MDETTTETSVPVVDGTEDNEAVETSVEEVTEATESSEDFIPVAEEEGYVPVDLRDEYEFYDMMYNSFEEFRLDNTEQNELIVYDMNRLAKEVEEYQLTSMILQMLTCGFLGIIIGVCLVNIFKKR